jgi:protein-tyrosine phosphatase
MAASGVTTVVATPHFDASLARRPDQYEARLAALDAAWERLRDIASERALPTLERGAEVKLDTPEPDLSDPRIRLGGGRFALVEFPYFSIPPRSVSVVEWLTAQSITPVIAHPERYRGLIDQLDTVRSWREAGALIQVNGASLIGRYGEAARAGAVELLARGWADYLCSDYHARGRTEIDDYLGALVDLGGAEQARLLTESNPRDLLEGRAPTAVPPLAGRRGFWERLTRAFRGAQREAS